ncbi:hypothetical protein SAMN04488051_102248 [Alkalimonas amylolytica]|uniref:Uncharacterized protein n=1 Tax=Alkalimonas amylolytica TaxID=152573 RepID=A0A1H3ZLZ3_ALKAM|nr:hypothetical protein SAMN04488051_102248 [Alkalimonas amylolytica]
MEFHYAVLHSRLQKRVTVTRLAVQVIFGGVPDSLHYPVDAVSYLLTTYLLATALIVCFGWLLSRHL